MSEQLHYEVKVTVLQNSRFKYAYRHCEAHADRTPARPHVRPTAAGYAMDGRAVIDNNVIEPDIGPFVAGRKLWLHSDAIAGAKASAMVYSLVLTSRACGVEPYAYLLHVITELPQRSPGADISDLLPFNYAKRQAEANVN